MNKILVLFAFLFLALLFVSFELAGADCEVCEDVENIFTLDEVELGTSNTITLKGYDSHGLRYLSISCEMLCGRLNQPCCWNDDELEYDCPASYKLYCSEQTENGICLEDTNPPNVTINGLPPDYTTDPATLTIICNEQETECIGRRFYFDIHGTIINGSAQSTCNNDEIGLNYDNYDSEYPKTLSQGGWVCAAGIDVAGNDGYTPKPLEVKITSETPPKPNLLIITDYGADYAVLVWEPIDYPDSLFEHYEIHFSQTFDFVPVQQTLYATDTELTNSTGTNKVMRVNGLNASTTYHFRVVAVTTAGVKDYKGLPRTITTRLCNDGQTRPCGYNNKGRCKMGTETCVGGFWSGLCVGAILPLNESEVSGVSSCQGGLCEICNNINDDCDDYTDEDNQMQFYWFEAMSQPCNTTPMIGECEGGKQYCVSGEWGDECRDEITPQPEECDGLDNDCDGTVDDVNDGTSVEETQCACYNRESFPSSCLIETCNQIDDDCNEVIDDVLCRTSILDTMCGCYDNSNPSTEKCNGIDDDCNADDFTNPFFAVDDPWQKGGGNVGDANYLGLSCGIPPCDGGVYECNAYGNETVCSTMPGGSGSQALEEICDGEDNDCDMSIDEDCPCAVGNETTCGFDEGECELGRQFCEQAGNTSTWGDCIGASEPQPEVCGDMMDTDCDGIVDDLDWCGCYGGALPTIGEICDGIDNDCDNIIDNVNGGNSVADTKCLCFGLPPGDIKKGEYEEKCNEIDDNCNADEFEDPSMSIDEPWREGGEEANEYYYLGLSCGYESSRCSGGQYVCAQEGNDMVCNTMSTEGIGESQDLREDDEECNAIDDDCNGIIDDILGLMSMEATHCRCYDNGQPMAEFCNEIDDDCNAKIDEDLFCVCNEGDIKACGSSIGICKLGHKVCVNGDWGECIGGVNPREEVCNMRDDDCNGMIDDIGGGYSVDETQCGCFNGRDPAVEDCDGIDNDCNGQIDDDIDCSCDEGDEMACGSNVGECMPGVKECVDGMWGTCTGGVLPVPEVCDGKDNDCDGIVDNVNGGSSISSTKCACYSRFATPGTQNEICNGIDDDCDEDVDEGCAQEQPSHCSNGYQDGDEEGPDCGGSCPNPCFELPPLNTWILVFAVLAGVIAIFGIFFSSFWKKTGKSLFERTK